MSAYDDVYTALQQGLTAAEHLLGYVLAYKPYASEITEDRINAIRRGIAALDELNHRAKPCTRAHLDLDAEPVDGCLCHVSINPPCGWCESGCGSEASATQPMPTFEPGELDAIRAEAVDYMPDLSGDPVFPDCHWIGGCANPLVPPSMLCAEHGPDMGQVA